MENYGGEEEYRNPAYIARETSNRGKIKSDTNCSSYQRGSELETEKRGEENTFKGRQKVMVLILDSEHDKERGEQP